jgi:hypothetical protein
MVSGAPNSEGQFIVVGQGFPDVLLGSQVFFLVPRLSWRRGGRCPGRFLEMLLCDVALLGC